MGKSHKFTQQHAKRMYECLALVHNGLERGAIKSKPIVRVSDNYEIESLTEIVAAALDSRGGRRLAVELGGVASVPQKSNSEPQ